MMTGILSVIALIAVSWLVVGWVASLKTRNPLGQKLLDIAVPALFGIAMLLLWEVTVRLFAIPQVLLPAPSAIWARITASVPILWADFRQTFLKAVIIGYVAGCGLGFITAIIADRIPFLRKGLLPLGNLAAALPIVGVAPIMVMWFGFDWQSKAAVVIIMTFSLCW